MISDFKDPNFVQKNFYLFIVLLQLSIELSYFSFFFFV